MEPKRKERHTPYMRKGQSTLREIEDYFPEVS